MSPTKQLFLIAFLLPIISLADYMELCPDGHSENGFMTWSSTDQCTISSPPCMGSDWKFQKRCCSHGQWTPEPQCHTVQFKLAECPPGFTDDNNNNGICHRLSRAAAFPPPCPFADQAPFASYQAIVDGAALGPVWMPVQRDRTAGPGPLRWTERSDLYRTIYADTYYLSGPALANDCLLYYNQSYVVAVPCSEKHRQMCAYKKLTDDRNNLCKSSDGACRQSDFDTNSSCFCVGSRFNSDHYLKVEFLKPYQNVLYASLTGDTCFIGLEQTADGKFVWTRSKLEINYTNWSKNVTFLPENRYGIFQADGWALTSTTNNTTINCIFHEKAIERKEPKLELSYNITSRKLKITAIHIDSLKWLIVDESLFLYCFTDASALSLIYRYGFPAKKPETDMMSYEFSPFQSVPGYYWCESFKYPTMQLIESNRVFVSPQNPSYEFVAIVQFKYVAGINPLDATTIEMVSRILFLRLGEVVELKYYYSWRIMKILHVNEHTNQITFNVHFTSINRRMTSLPVAEFYAVQAQIGKALSALDAVDMKLVDFRSTDFCPEKEEDSFGKVLTWPLTGVDQSTASREFCFTRSSSRLMRTCQGDFVDGAEWSAIVDECELQHFSDFSRDLIYILEQYTDKNLIMTAVANISQQYPQLMPIDIRLIGDIFFKIKNESVDLNELTTIVNNLHNVPTNILIESQTKMNATDQILQAIDDMAINSNLNETPQVITKSDSFFMTVSNLHETNIRGLSVYKNANIYKVVMVDNNTNIDDIDQNHLECVVLLSPELMKQLHEEQNSPKLVLNLYVSQSLFHENKKSSPRSVSKIFGVVLVNFRKTFAGPISIYHKSSPLNNKEICSFWKYGAHMQGSWANDGKGIRKSSFCLCEYFHTTNFAYLIMDDNRYGDKLHILELITSTNCTLSLIGLFCILLTGILFKKWRSNTGNQILINFSCTITLQIIIFFISNSVYEDLQHSESCVISGLILHYSLLSQFCWMLVIAVLQFKRFVEVLGGPPKSILLKACIVGWGLPLVPVVSVYLFDPMSYVKSNVNLCYPSGLGFYLGVWLPVFTLVAINFVIFVYIIYNVAHRKVECLDKSNGEILIQWKLAILLFFMLGLTWIFGLLTDLGFGIVFVYLFCFTATLQGFIMFLFFIIFNENTRCLYMNCFKKICYSNKYY